MHVIFKSIRWYIWQHSIYKSKQNYVYYNETIIDKPFFIKQPEQNMTITVLKLLVLYSGVILWCYSLVLYSGVIHWCYTLVFYSGVIVWCYTLVL